MSETSSNQSVCFDCGITHLSEKQKKEGGVCTFYPGTCCVCNQRKSVTHIRNYNYLNKLRV